MMPWWRFVGVNYIQKNNRNTGELENESKIKSGNDWNWNNCVNIGYRMR